MLYVYDERIRQPLGKCAGVISQGRLEAEQLKRRWVPLTAVAPGPYWSRCDGSPEQGFQRQSGTAEHPSRVSQVLIMIPIPLIPWSQQNQLRLYFLVRL